MRTGKTKRGVDIKATVGMPSPSTVWVMVADNAHARIFERADGTEITLKQEIAHPKGRTGGGHAMTSESDPKTHLSRLWASDLAGFLGKRIADYDEFILVAEPRLAGRIREELPEWVNRRMARLVQKDFACLPITDIRARVGKILEEKE